MADKPFFNSNQLELRGVRFILDDAAAATAEGWAFSFF